MFKIGNPEIFWALTCVPFVIIIHLLYRNWIFRSYKRFGNLELMSKLNENVFGIGPKLKFLIFVFGLILLILGLSDPKFGLKTEEVKKKGIDLVFALDISNSMLTEDIKPNRLERAKLIVNKTINELDGDRIGIVVFAGEAFTQLPLTTDYSAASLFLNTIKTDLVNVQGTAISEALNQSFKTFGNIEENQTRSRVIVVITDGEDHEGGIDLIADKIKKNNIIVDVLSIATENGGPIPDIQNGIKIGYKKSKDGSVIISRLNLNLMRELASTFNGIYLDGTTGEFNLDNLTKQINNMEKTDFGSKIISNYDSKFQWFLLASFLLLTLEYLIPDNISKWFKNLKLFS